ncbi:site-specific DNA-methyltransferase [Sinorhizobium meliloti]|nr:site-specific DNA-methyltransferase [Sinorhizobium meliloti]
MEPQSVHCCVTSPPYFGLRDYGHEGQMGLEPTPDDFVVGMVAVFREVRRVLRDDGTLWLNLGDSYAGSWGARGRGEGTNAARPDLEAKHGTGAPNRHGFPSLGVKPKDLIGIPWRVAFALQSDGWYLRQDIIWNKPNPMPESVRDRCTKAHEYIFLLSKSPRYYFDAEAILEPFADERMGASGARASKYSADGAMRNDGGVTSAPTRSGRNRRSVWTVSTKPFKGAHFATFPPDLIEPCVLAGCPTGGTVLDPFGGAGTTGLVAKQHGRNAVLCELNPEYAEMARGRIDTPIVVKKTKKPANDNNLSADLFAA